MKTLVLGTLLMLGTFSAMADISKIEACNIQLDEYRNTKGQLQSLLENPASVRIERLNLVLSDKIAIESKHKANIASMENAVRILRNTAYDYSVGAATNRIALNGIKKVQADIERERMALVRAEVETAKVQRAIELTQMSERDEQNTMRELEIRIAAIEESYVNCLSVAIKNYQAKL